MPLEIPTEIVLMFLIPFLMIFAVILGVFIADYFRSQEYKREAILSNIKKRESEMWKYTSYDMGNNPDNFETMRYENGVYHSVVYRENKEDAEY